MRYWSGVGNYWEQHERVPSQTGVLVMVDWRVSWRPKNVGAAYAGNASRRIDSSATPGYVKLPENWWFI